MGKSSTSKVDYEGTVPIVQRLSLTVFISSPVGKQKRMRKDDNLEIFDTGSLHICMRTHTAREQERERKRNMLSCLFLSK